MNQKPSKVVVVDNNPRFVEDLSAVFTAERAEINSYPTFDSFKSQNQTAADLLFINSNACVNNGKDESGFLKILQGLYKKSDQGEIVVYSNEVNLPLTVAAIKSGATDYLIQDKDFESRVQSKIQHHINGSKTEEINGYKFKLRVAVAMAFALMISGMMLLLQ